MIALINQGQQLPIVIAKKFLHQKLAETFFPLIENKMINSFIKRANDILN